MITKSLLVEIMPECECVINPYIKPLNDMFKEFGFDTARRQAAFIAQAAHESVRFAALTQTYNYSAKGLRRVFPMFFTDDQALQYAHKPLKITSRIFAGKLGNGDEPSTDGWKYRPRGFIPRIQGAAWYRRIGESLWLDTPDLFLRQPDILATPQWSIRVAGWFWSTNDCMQMADEGTEQSFRSITRTINTGLHGLTDRLYLYSQLLPALEGNIEGSCAMANATQRLELPPQEQDGQAGI